MDNTCLKRRTQSFPQSKPNCHTYDLSLFFFFFLISWIEGKHVTHAALSLTVLFCLCFLLDIVFNLPQKFFHLNRYVHKETQTLMAIIMFMRSALRCGFNISFRGTSLNNCKLFPSGSSKSKHQVLCVPQLSQYLCMCESEIQTEGCLI